MSFASARRPFTVSRGLLTATTLSLGTWRANVRDGGSRVTRGTPASLGRYSAYVAWVAHLKDYKRPEAFVELARRFEATGIDFLLAGALVRKTYSWIAEMRGTPSNFQYLGLLTPQQVNGLLKSAIVPCV